MSVSLPSALFNFRGNCSFIMTRSLRVAASRIYSHLMSQPKEWKLAENFLNWRFSHPSINAGFPPQRYPTSTNSVAHFHTTYYLEKKKQSTKKQKSKDRATPMEDEVRRVSLSSCMTVTIAAMV